MSESTPLNHLYLEFKGKYLEELGSIAHKEPVSVEDAEKYFGFKVKEIKSFVEQEDINEKYFPYMRDQLARTLILGTAFPTTTGWILLGYPYTIFIAYGFNGEYCVFALGNSNKEVYGVDPRVIENEYVSMAVEYTEETATIFEMANPDKKPITRYN